MAITPTREQFSEFAHGERDGEVVMINLLHFAAPDGEKVETAETTDGESSGAQPSGASEYRRYSDDVVKMVEAGGDGCSGPAGPSTC